VVCACCTVPATAAAQQHIRANEWSRGTTLNGFAGATMDSSQSGPAIGGAVGWELTPRVAIEGSGSWADFGQDTNSFAGALKVRLRIAGRRYLDPFVQTGVGLYRASFGTSDPAVPAFYRRRMVASTQGSATSGTFTDPTLIGGGGVSIFLNRHFALRPDAEVAFVFRDGNHHVVTTVALHAVYHFESHPVTPVRGR
jgi:hypothetical protein